MKGQIRRQTGKQKYSKDKGHLRRFFGARLCSLFKVPL
jgi:hypothetical protein